MLSGNPVRAAAVARAPLAGADCSRLRASPQPTPLLDSCNYPVHLKNLRRVPAPTLCAPTRAATSRRAPHSTLTLNPAAPLSTACRSSSSWPRSCVQTQSTTCLRRVPPGGLAFAAGSLTCLSQSGGHLGSSLGVIELTVALHYVYDCPDDKFIWDVGHQAYPHKILTGRRKGMKTIRQTGGLSPFTKRAESEYDCFGAGHSSTSISAGLGMAVGRDLKGANNHVVAIIGDGAITGGMAYEAMNNAGYLDKNMVIILNDNQQVSLPTQYNNKNQDPVGALSSAFGRLQANRPLRELREQAKLITKSMPMAVQEITAKVDEYARGLISGSGATLFEELGLYYIGTVDGHNLDDLVAILQEVKNTASVGPVLIHVVTEKGRGYTPAERAQDRYHGVAKFDFATGAQVKAKTPVPSYTQFFAESLVAEARADERVVAIHAAMGGGTGLTEFEKVFPNRVFDVGIAEQHAVTFAAGLASEGLKPFCAIYSTFLQRGYDQIVHDVALQKLPVRFAMDRAGLVGADGPTHCGAFDVAYLGCIPEMVVMAPSNEAELCHMIATAAAYDERPTAFRYPRGNGVGVDLAAAGVGPGMKGKVLEIGRGRVVSQGDGSVCLLGYGTAVNNCLAAAALLKEQCNVVATVADARFCKPLDVQLVRQLAKSHGVMVIVEEGSIGGFASHVLQFLALDGLLDSGALKVRPMVLPDTYIDHGSYEWQVEQAGMSAGHVAATALTLLGRQRESLGMLGAAAASTAKGTREGIA